MNYYNINDTVKELYFTEEDLEERLSEVKDNFWGDIEPYVLSMIKKFLETGMEVEIEQIIGGESWEHIEDRSNYRNGYYSRNLWTKYGYIRGLKVPRVRYPIEGGLKTIEYYQRRAREVNEMIKEMFLAGVSTRRVKEVLEPIYGKEMISSTTVSKVVKELDSSVKKFHSRKIEDEYEDLILDAIYLKVKSPRKSKEKCILVAYGIRTDGVRELIDYKIAAKGESQTAWENFLTGLYHRGLEGKKLKLVVTDGNKGLINAVELVWPNALRQRCWAHKIRNVANYLPKKTRYECVREMRKIYEAKDKMEAIKRFREWARRWERVSSRAVNSVEEDLEELLNFYECPSEMRIRLRTTNIIERVFREVRRRTRSISCFTNTASVERIIFAIFKRQNDIWRTKPLKKPIKKNYTKFLTLPRD
jgi:transposase-like protein